MDADSIMRLCEVYGARRGLSLSTVSTYEMIDACEHPDVGMP